MSEALGLDEAHVDWGARSYAFTAKGGEVRHKPMATEVRDLLWRQRPPEGRGGPMFRGATGERIQYEALASAFRRAARRAGVADFRIHDLRHTQATRLLRRTGNLALVAASLDHANVETTMRYAHVLDADLRAALDGAEVPAKSPTVKPEAAKRKAKSTA